MAKKKKSYLIAGLAIAITIVTAGAATVSAATTNMNSPMDNLVTAIATKFNLNASDVQKVFDEQKIQMQTLHKQEFHQKSAQKLEQAVTNKKLTQDQANKITAKRIEINNQIKSLEGKTAEERGAVMKLIMDSLKQWATVNNIPTQYIMMSEGMGMRKGHDQNKIDFQIKGQGKKLINNSSSTVQN